MNDSEITIRIEDTRRGARKKTGKTASMVIDIGDAAKNTKKSTIRTRKRIEPDLLYVICAGRERGSRDKMEQHYSSSADWFRLFRYYNNFSDLYTSIASDSTR